MGLVRREKARSQSREAVMIGAVEEDEAGKRSHERHFSAVVFGFRVMQIGCIR